LTIWEIEDLLTERAREQREAIHWLIAASPYGADKVKARYGELERGFTKMLRLDEFMERKAAEKKAREELN